MNKKQLEQERAELNALIGNGIEFEIEDTEFEIKKSLFGIIKKRTPITARKKFKIEEPTLGTLDRLSAEWIELAIDEGQLLSGDSLQKAKGLVYAHSKRCAKIVAIAVLGSDYLIPKCNYGGRIKYVEDKERLASLTELFTRTVKPSTLFQLCVSINAMLNLGDFTNSIRLMSSDRTAMPIRIEGNSEV